MIYMVIGILIGLGFAVFIAFALFLQGYESETCIITLLVVGLIFCSLGGLIGHWGDADEKNNKTIKTTINANYDNITNYHNDKDNKTFVSDSSKYTFDDDADVTFVDWVRQKGEK